MLRLLSPTLTLRRRLKSSRLQRRRRLPRASL